NTHPFLVTFVMGIVLSLEQQKADIPTIRAVRVAAMGPLGGIGDALFWFTLVPITAGITANMAIDGSVLGPILFLVIFNAAQFAVRFFLMHWSYELGTNAIGVLTKNAKEFTRSASILGVFIVGALVSNYGATSVRISLSNGVGVNSVLNIQSILNGVLPQLVPLLLTLLVFYFLKKHKWSPTKAIALLLVIGIAGTALGIWSGSAGAVNPETGKGIRGGYNPLVEWYEYRDTSDYDGDGNLIEGLTTDDGTPITE
ncbi:MAG: PTS system mannose/fructose/sorbose family transporter subunit IID, partial [Erysipelothrix sp.]|nr:PTS system mannose/fructose/sorbose family transporter subunit IID [Erysipelothrix sp.]